GLKDHRAALWWPALLRLIQGCQSKNRFREVPTSRYGVPKRIRSAAPPQFIPCADWRFAEEPRHRLLLGRTVRARGVCCRHARTVAGNWIPLTAGARPRDRLRLAAAPR